MIFDALSRLSRYDSVHPDIPRVRAFLDSHDLLTLAAGKIDLGKGLSVGISDYETKPASECKNEAHRAFIDIQMIAYGEECIGFAPLESGIPKTDFDTSKDVWFFSNETERLTLKPGFFMIFFPEDIHTPGPSPVSGPQKVRKLVFKLPVL